jgi:hypothetical protein
METESPQNQPGPAEEKGGSQAGKKIEEDLLFEVL